MVLSLSISAEAEAKLKAKAAAAGVDVETYAARHLDLLATSPKSLKEISGPIAEAFSRSGMSEDELSDFLISEVPNPPHISRSSRVKKLIFWVLFGMSLALNVGLISYAIIPRERIDGGGQYARSQDGKYEASADSLQDTNNSKGVYYVFSIKTPGGHPIKTVRIDAKETADSCYFRRLPSIIQWSPDSKEVVFNIPGIQLKMDCELHRDSAVPG